ncbi:thiamine phosphate synthase [Bythopirellula polymerisocia]|uniref:Thiamine-phosphate synthase n=1 Tax=Bythopirellula polymerisocia TaxID=2528003 RepID=A0A5C6CDU4_9BACT|nr:thiamine phosphate synthase [Bythopirellula polymerisocia]TWU21927.1 Thiamine-phosphate synthase [Bythopirellula polymerisocia]
MILHNFMSDNSTFRVLDAAANRALEGARVVEDFCRFVLDDAHLTRLVKELRHDLAPALVTLPRESRHAQRETQQDIGTEISTPSEATRTDAWDVCQASSERVKQSLRSLEEFSKTISPEIASRFEALRYQWYTIEKSLSATHTSRSRLGDVRLCVLVDGRESIEAFAELVQQLADAGVDMIQLRDKTLGDRELVKRASLLREISCSHEPAPLVIINDRADIATAANADGAHLGQDDLNVKAARAIIGPRKLIGVSTHNIEQARAAVLDGANYIGVGPTFPSQTKSFDQFPGTELLKQVAAEISLPAFAIGGLTLESLPEVLKTGITRVAVSGAVVGADNPRAALTVLLNTLTRDESIPP